MSGCKKGRIMRRETAWEEVRGKYREARTVRSGNLRGNSMGHDRWRRWQRSERDERRRQGKERGPKERKRRESTRLLGNGNEEERDRERKMGQRQGHGRADPKEIGRRSGRGAPEADEEDAEPSHISAEVVGVQEADGPVVCVKGGEEMAQPLKDETAGGGE